MSDEVVATTAKDRLPCWSPNGKKILFQSGIDAVCNDEVCVNPSNNYELYIMSVDGTELTNITKNTACDAISTLNNSIQCWSPDGKKIVFHSNRDGKYDIYTVNSDGTDLKQLTKKSGDNWGCSWSPN